MKKKRKQVRGWVLAMMLACLLPAAKVRAQDAPTAVQAAATDANREELLKLLRESPTLTAVVASDPSLLGNQEYVAKSNPELAKFLAQHPEIGRNPDFYLFADMHVRGPNRVQALERRVWNGAPEDDHDTTAYRIVNDIVPMLVAFAFIAAAAWLVKVLLANRRWTKIFRLQTEVHGKLIDRFGSSQEILNYMQTDAGKRFLEASPIAVDFEREERWPVAMQRVLMPLSAGVVLTLLGLGLLALRHSIPHGETALLLFGVVAVMPGLGCIIAAGVTWLMAKRLGLLPSGARDGQ